METRSAPLDQAQLICGRCGRHFGTIANYGVLNGVRASFPCPCGGLSELIDVGEIYQVFGSELASEDWLRREVARALEAFKRESQPAVTPD